ncbi:MAG: hypothetical protein M2R45_05396 [Verrucomicrobia subdivision 3 bacterium]|nr:hypothetical protein [Limisphaerales bacterium]MCS1412650.1 hypothetical protein [Limisphaerales bacterium]
MCSYVRTLEVALFPAISFAPNSLGRVWLLAPTLLKRRTSSKLKSPSIWDVWGFVTCDGRLLVSEDRLLAVGVLPNVGRGMRLPRRFV